MFGCPLAHLAEINQASFTEISALALLSGKTPGEHYCARTAPKY